ncbi:MAG: AAA family ATPase, partial [Treponema sp.]|nr:AAA family ATPase [Treponema sp.]
MEAERALPIGIQDFEKLRTTNCIYVDKTNFVYKLVKTDGSYFLSRPRRFGKSLLLSTIEAYFLGKKELFEGLAIYDKEAGNPDAWQAYPVLKFSLAAGEFTKPEGLRNRLNNTLANFEEDYGLPDDRNDLPVRFENALKNAKKQTGKKVVVLVDEYDNPLLKNIGVNEAQGEANRALYKAFFSVLKDCDAY